MVQFSLQVANKPILIHLISFLIPRLAMNTSLFRLSRRNSLVFRAMPRCDYGRLSCQSTVHCAVESF